MAINHYQSAFPTTPDEGLAGHPAGTGEYLAESLTNDEAATRIGFGLGVKANGEDGCKLPASSADAIDGVTMYVPLVQPDANFDRKVPTDGVCLVMQRGRIWVEVEETVAKNDPVYVRHTANGAGKDPGQFRKDSDGSEGVYPQVSWTLSGALDAGRARIQKLVLSADLIAGDDVDGEIGGTAIATVSYDGVSHLTTMELIMSAIQVAADTAGEVIDNMYIAGATAREIHILSDAHSPTALPLTSWATTNGGAGTAAFASATGADVTAGKLPHTLTLDVDGDTITAEWSGSHDDTVHTFAAELESHAKVASAVVTHVAAGPDLVITLTGANYLANDIDLANGDPTGGVNARTGALNNEVVAGVAVSAKAAQWTGARYAKGAAAGKNALLEVFGTE